MRIRDIVAAKELHGVVTLPPDATVRELLALLAEKNVGALVVSPDGSQVDGIVGRMIEELGVPTSEVNVIATGGLAPIVVEECRSFTAHQPWLTLLGLELVFARNS